MASIDYEQQPHAPAAATDAPTVAATAAAAKRSAKKLKKKAAGAATSAAKSSDDDEDNANNIATVDHPYLSFLHKRIRLYKKKLEKIKTLEAAQIDEGKVLNVQQLELVNSKFAMEKILSEFESLREQFIEVYLQEEAAKKAAQEQQAAEAAKAAAAAATAVETLVDVIVDETVAELAEQSAATEKIEATEKVETPADALEPVRDVLKALHVVNLHQALGRDVPMVLDFFAKVLLGNTRPVAEVAFEENLAESLAEARKYVARSDELMACDATYRDLRRVVDELAQLNVRATEATPEAAAPDALPEINFFTDSVLEAPELDASTDDKADEHADAPEEIADVARVEDEDVAAELVGAADTGISTGICISAGISIAAVEDEPRVVAPSPASIPAPPMSFAAAAASVPATQPQSQQAPRRRPQSGRGGPKPSGEGGARAEGGGEKPRRARPNGGQYGSNGGNGNGSGNNSNSGGSGFHGSAHRPKDERRPRVDRALRKPHANIHQPHAHASPLA